MYTPPHARARADGNLFLDVRALKPENQ
jgi:hypothetical protein